MFKKLDWYTIKTYFGPFIFIFSVLFFIFMVQFAWQEMEKFAGKGLSTFEILKLLFFGGLSLVQLVMPLTVLLAAIMTFGSFGERYELASMKSSGLSLWRIMRPLFIFICFLSVGLYFFSDRVVTLSERKGKNMLLNIARTKPALNFAPGVFVTGVPGFSMKIGDKSGESGEFLKEVFIHKDVSSFENQQTIVAKEGLIEPAPDKRFLKLALYDGYFYEDEIKNLNRRNLERQPFRSIKFDTLTYFFDISSIVEKAIEREQVSDHYKFMKADELMSKIDTLNKQDSIAYSSISKNTYSSFIYNHAKLDTLNKSNVKSKLPLLIKDLAEKDRERLYQGAILEINRDQDIYETNQNQIRSRRSYLARHVMVFSRKFSNSLMCIAFFLIGAPLGAIIRKGGVGMPVVVAIIIFVLFYLIYMYSENLAKNGVMNPWVASWLPLAVFMPLGIIFTYKAMTDSVLFDLDAYLKPFKKVFNIFAKNKEHSRYQ